MAKRNRKNPSLLFFFNDWENEPGLKYCSLAAEAMWLRMIGIATRSPEFGVVLIGKGTTTRQDVPALLAGLCRSTVEDCAAMLGELIKFEVAEVDDHDRVYCRRMVREAEISAERSRAGKRGAAATNSKLKKSGKPTGKPADKRGNNDIDNANSKAAGKTEGERDALNDGNERDIPAVAETSERQNIVNGDGNHADKKSASSSFLPFSLSDSDRENLTETSIAPDGAGDETSDEPTLIMSGGDAEPPELQVLKAWNVAADLHSWPKPRRGPIAADRRKAILARIKEAGGVGPFLEILVMAERSRFIREDMTAWSLDWFLKPMNFRKVADGNYRDRGRGRANSAPPSRMKRRVDIIDRLERKEQTDGE